MSGVSFNLDSLCNPAMVNYLEPRLYGQWSVEASVVPSDFTTGVWEVFYLDLPCNPAMVN